MATSISADGMFLSGEKTVTTGGTAEALLADKSTGGLFWTYVRITAKAANTNQVYVGGSDVASTTNDGLDAGETLELRASDANPRGFDLTKIFIDVDTDGEGVELYATK